MGGHVHMREGVCHRGHVPAPQVLSIITTPLFVPPILYAQVSKSDPMPVCVSRSGENAIFKNYFYSPISDFVTSGLIFLLSDPKLLKQPSSGHG